MRYTLAMLTHGSHDEWVGRTLTSFLDNVRPLPSNFVFHRDEAGEGFSQATARLWQKASETHSGYVFWLEHDFVVTRPIRLWPLAQTLDLNPHLAQLALYRDPVTAEEQQAGGYMRLKSDLFEKRSGWYEQRSWWTTNPSLMRTDTLRWHPWPPVPDCEVEAAKLALAFDPSIRFGVWGDGRTHVRHIGHRDGTGY